MSPEPGKRSCTLETFEIFAAVSGSLRFAAISAFFYSSGDGFACSRPQKRVDRVPELTVPSFSWRTEAPA